MKNRTLTLVIVAVILGAIYAYKFTDWFAGKKIQIKYRILSSRNKSGVEPVTFYLDKEYQLKSLKVISLAEAATNKYPHALWESVSETNSAPVADFIYGENIAGMKPKVPGLAAEPLQRGKSYRIYLESGAYKGEKDFQLR